jgi:DNA primase
MPISQDTIQQIRYRADVLEVVGDFVSLKKKGVNYWACCPFHDEKSPSFSINPVKGIYKCFGCGKAGDSIGFVMEIEKVSYVEALRYLAKKYDIAIAEEKDRTAEQIQQQNERDSLFITLEYAKKFFRQQLLSTEAGQSIALPYFRERGFSEQTIEKFELGFSQEAFDGLFKDATKNGYTAEALEKAGLVLKKETGGHYDRFRGRVIFPIHNVSGRVVGFTARILTSDKNQPKYINSPETEVYHKSEILYGLFQAKNAIRNLDLCYLTEGNTDVISLHQAGIQNVVASSGTSLTVPQIRLIRRFTPNITLIYDGDNAGIKAALRGLDLMLEEEINLQVVILPDKEDPDSYLRRVGSSAFQDFVQKNGRNLVELKIELFREEARHDPIQKSKLVGDILGSVAKIRNQIQVEAFVKQTGAALDVDEGRLYGSLREILQKESQKTKPNDFRPKEEPVEDFQETSDNQEDAKEMAFVPLLDPVVYQEEETIRLLISYASQEIREKDTVSAYLLRELQGITFQNPVYNKILTLFREQISRGERVEETFFLHHPDTEIQQQAIQMLSPQYEFSHNWQTRFDIYVPHEKDHLDAVAYSNMLRLKQRLVQRLMSDVMKKLQTAEEAEEQTRYMKMYKQLKDNEKELAKELGNVLR